MASSATPYGLRPSKMIGSGYQTSGLNRYKIASGYNTNIFTGDVVKLVAAGTIEKDTGTTTATPIGVFMGVEYEPSTDEGLLHRQYWPADQTLKAGTQAWAYVVDDPDMLFEIQADESVAQAGIGANAPLVQGAGSTATGLSGVSLDGGSIATTATLPLRIVDYVDKVGFSEIGDAYTDLIVKFVTHQHRTALGI